MTQPARVEPGRSRRRLIGMQRVGLRLIGVVILAVSVAGCTGHAGGRASSPGTTTRSTGGGVTSTTTTPEPLQHFSGGTTAAISFDHPAAWRESRYVESGSFSDLIVYLSDARLHAPCTTTRTNGGELTRCDWPLRKLAPGEVLVSWSNIGFPHEGPEIPHPNATINGRPARIEVASPGACSAVGGDETITADIARPRGNHYEMVACLRGPNLSRSEALVNRMVDSAHVTG